MSFVGNALNKITGADKAVDAQVGMANQSAALSKEQFEEIQKDLAPFLQFGTNQLQGLGGLMQPLNRQQELAQFYQSPEFAMPTCASTALFEPVISPTTLPIASPTKLIVSSSFQ